MFDIIFASDSVAAIKIKEITYFIRLDERMPEIFNSQGDKMAITDADSWTKNGTSNQYQYVDLVKYCKYWREGYHSNFVNEQLDSFIEYVIMKTKNEIFTSSLASEYASEYWIECTPQNKISSKLLSPIIKKSENLIDKLGYKTISDYLNRVRKIIQEKQDMIQIEKIMKKLEINEAEISYPATNKIDNKLLNKLKMEINQNKISRVSQNIRSILNECESKLL